MCYLKHQQPLGPMRAHGKAGAEYITSALSSFLMQQPRKFGYAYQLPVEQSLTNPQDSVPTALLTSYYTSRLFDTISSTVEKMSISKFTASMASFTNENSLALLNLNIDLALFKFEPPQEYLRLGDTLSLSRRCKGNTMRQHGSLVHCFNRFFPRRQNF
jgi:hypothetical protein